MGLGSWMVLHSFYVVQGAPDLVLCSSRGVGGGVYVIPDGSKCFLCLDVVFRCSCVGSQ